MRDSSQLFVTPDAFMQKMQTSLCRLRDKRVLEYAEFGDPEGMPVIFLHSCMGSCQQVVLAHAHACSERVRIIAPNRPGIGKSTPADFTAMTDYADDIRQLADFLGIKTFAVVGISGGGSFALACGYALPKRVRLVGVIGGIGPMNVVHNLQHMTLFRRLFLQGCHGYPTIAYSVISAFFRFCKRWPKVSYNWLVQSTSLLDPEMLSREDINKILWWDYANVFLQRSGIKGLLLETKLYFHWGFDLKNFPEETHVLFWHGKDDPVLSWSAMREMAKPIPHSEQILCPGGHMTFLMNRTDKILMRMKHEWNPSLRLT